MDLLQPHLANIKVPSQNDKVYKDECVFSFDNPETETGLYVSLTSFVGLGHDFVERYFNRTGRAVYLHLKREKEEVSTPPQGDGPEKKITRLAIGVEGGFNTDASNKKYKYTDFYNVVVMPGFVAIPWPNDAFPEIVKQSVQAVLDLPSASKLAELEALSGTWDGEARVISKYANNLQQLNNDIKIPPSGWKCGKCDKTENLWLNLTDGTILCGRKFFDGSGGNNHAMEHYSTTGYPLAVKLGTITKDGKADVFSYAEDDMVEDPNLIEHLAHWGINIQNMEKTEKSMIELELELNQKNEWAALTEQDGQLKPIYGPGYTGMTNMGNSCYLNSVMQMLFVVPDFIHKYFNGCDLIFAEANGDPAEDFNVQLAKIGYGLLSGKYSAPPPAGSDVDPPGICPLMFKTLVGRGHPEFSTKKQQDVQEFMLHLLTLLERNTKNKGQNPGDCFKFKVEEKYQCGSSKKVKYVERSELILPLMIPMEAAINKEEVAAYEAKKAEYEAKGQHLESESLVRPKIKFFSCLEMFRESEVINNFYSTAIGQNVTARKTTRLATFPDYLLVQLRKFMLREDWVPIKLDVSIEMPDILDLSSLRSDGLQPGEELLPEPEGQTPAVVLDEGIISQLEDMGFPNEACKKAVFFTQNGGLEHAAQWLMEHCSDPDFTSPFVPPGTENNSKFTPNPEHEQMIISMGFTKEQADKALKATDNNIERAMDWIFSHQDELDAPESPGAPKFKDGDSKYKLVGFISHMGTSSMVGHYVVHLQKNGQWVIFNDNKVALSENPPKDLGYMYLYERL